MDAVALTEALGLPMGRMTLCFLVVFAAGILRGYTGFGFALAAVPALALIISPVMVVPLVLCLEIVASAQMLPRLWREVHFRSVGWLAIGSLLGVPLGLHGLATVPDDAMRLVIALIVLSSLGAIMVGARLRAQPGRPATMAVGALSGLLNGAAAMGGPPVILFYLGSQTAVQVGRASLVLYFALVDSVAAGLAAASGLLDGPLLVLAALSLPALFAGQVIGERLFRSSLQRHYRAVAVAVLGFVSIAVLLQSAMTLTG